MDRGFHGFGFEGCGGLVVLSLRREGTYTVSPSEPRNESPSEPRLPVEKSNFHGIVASTSTPSTRRLLDGVAVPVPHRSTQLVLVDFHTAGCPADPGAGSGASPASRAAPGASPAARRRPGRTAGAEVNARADDGATPLARLMWEFSARACQVKILEILLRAGASLDSVRNNDSFDALLQSNRGSRNEHFVAMRDIVASVRRHGSWKAHCIAPHRMVLRLRSLVARGRAKLPRARRRSQASASSQALYFLVRQGDNGIVWNILSYWRATK